MAWGIVIAAVGLVLMVVLMLEEVEVETESRAFDHSIPFKKQRTSFCLGRNGALSH